MLHFLKLLNYDYPNVPSSLQKEEIRIVVTFKLYANSSAHTLLQYSIAKVKFVHDKLWFGKINYWKIIPDIHRSVSVGMLNLGMFCCSKID